MVTFQDFRNALSNVTTQSIYTESWQLAKRNLANLSDQALSEGNSRVAAEIADGISTLYETLENWGGEKEEILEEIKTEDNRLRRYGFADIADRVKDFWENQG